MSRSLLLCVLKMFLLLAMLLLEFDIMRHFFEVRRWRDTGARHTDTKLGKLPIVPVTHQKLARLDDQ